MLKAVANERPPDGPRNGGVVGAAGGPPARRNGGVGSGRAGLDGRQEPSVKARKRGRPALPKSSRRVSLTVRLSQPTARILKERARSADMPVSRLVKMMVKESVVDQLYFRGKK